MGGLFQAGYFFPFLKALEVVLGALLLVRLLVPLSLVILMPITLNIFLFHAFLEPATVAISAAMIALNLYLLWSYREYYKPLLHFKSHVTV